MKKVFFSLILSVVMLTSASAEHIDAHPKWIMIWGAIRFTTTENPNLTYQFSPNIEFRCKEMLSLLLMAKQNGNAISFDTDATGVVSMSLLD